MGLRWFTVYATRLGTFCGSKAPRIESGQFEGTWTDEQKQVFADTLSDLGKKDKGLPPSQNTLNKLLRFFTGSYKEPVGGFKDLKFSKVPDDRCAPLVGKTCFNNLRIPSTCLTSMAMLENIIKESVVSEGFYMA